MARDAGKKLFHAIVVTGAALGACGDSDELGGEAKCGAKQLDASVPDRPGNTGGAAAPAAAGRGSAGSSGADAPLEAGAPNEAGQAPDDDADADVAFPHITE
jgi:hypothetical protein